ncbi:MAG: DUF3971 domain-containing protein [Ectothiorhodospiraceae bacterium]
MSIGNCLRFACRCAATGLVALLALIALAAAALHGLAFYLSQNPDAVAARIAAALDHPVAIDELDVAWRGREIVLDLAGVRLGGSDDALAVPRLQVDLDLLDSLVAGEPRFRELTLAECRVVLMRERDGNLRTAGVDLEIRNRGLLDALMAKSGAIRLTDSDVILDDRRLGEQRRVANIDARLDTKAGERRLAGVADLPGAWGERARFVLHWPEDATAPLRHGSLEAYAHGEGVRPALMEELLGAPERSAPVAVGGSVSVWADLPGGVAAGVAELTAEARDGSAIVPGMFRERLVFRTVRAQARGELTDHGWRLDVPHLAIANGVGKLTGRGSAEQDGDAAPELAVRARLEGTDDNVERLERYLPAGVMPPDVLAWLDESIRSGTLATAELRLEGPVDAFPYDDGGGVFDLRAAVADVGLAYHPDWPALTGLSGRLHFRGRSMAIAAAHGRVGEARIRRARAGIDTLGADDLVIRGRVSGPGEAYLDFLRAMPPASETMAALPSLGLTGEHGLDLALGLPLDGSGPPRVNGRLTLNNGALRLTGQELAVTGIDGSLRFDRRGLSADAVTGRVLGSDVTFSAATDPADDESPRIRADLDLAGLPGERLAALAGIQSGTLAGTTAASLSATLPPFDRAGDSDVALQATTDLDGLAVNAPAPLGKAADTRIPVTATTALGEDGPGPLQLRYGERFAVQAALAPGGGIGAAGFRLGGAPAELPPDGRLRVSGQTPELDVVAWRRWLTRHSGADAGIQPDRFDVTVGNLRAGGLAWSDQSVTAQREESGWRLAFSGEDLRGRVDWPRDPERVAAVELDYLALSLPGADTVDPEATPDDRLADVDPAALRDLRLRIDRLVVAGRPLGRVRITGRSTESGYRLDPLRLTGANHRIRGTGGWWRDPDHRTQLQLRVRSQDMGALLSGLGYRDIMRGGRGRGDISGQVAAPPWPPELETLDGQVELTVRDGHLTQVEPGPGRVFGLLSIAHLPRRLALEFGDVVESGFAFDRIEARFRIAEGQATPEALFMEGPSARVDAAGVVDVAERVYDQVLTVTPKASTTLPVLGGLVGGPPGAAAMFLAEQVLGGSVNDVAAVRYRLTGPWHDPQLESISGNGLLPGG